MRIFLSYASEHRATADRIAVGLGQEGHSVFFDRDDLPAGEGYDQAIRHALGEADLLIFLVSPESVSPESYALTELGLARKRWRNPSGRVLPVVVSDVPMQELPAYLRSVTMLEPKGNTTAEVLAAVAALGAARTKKMRARALAGAGIVLLAVVAGVIAVRPLPPRQPRACSLDAGVVSEPGVSPTGELVAYVTGGGSTTSFVISDEGRRTIQVAPEQQQRWSIDIVNADGVSLGTAHLDGCPLSPMEFELDEKHRLTLAPS